MAGGHEKGGAWGVEKGETLHRIQACKLGKASRESGCTERCCSPFTLHIAPACSLTGPQSNQPDGHSDRPCFAAIAYGEPRAWHEGKCFRGQACFAGRDVLPYVRCLADWNCHICKHTLPLRVVPPVSISQVLVTTMLSSLPMLMVGS